MVCIMLLQMNKEGDAGVHVELIYKKGGAIENSCHTYTHTHTHIDATTRGL